MGLKSDSSVCNDLWREVRRDVWYNVTEQMPFPVRMLVVSKILAPMPTASLSTSMREMTNLILG